MDTLFKLPRQPLLLETQDLAEGTDDPLEIWLMRRHWKLHAIKNIQASISKKLTVDMFTGKTEKLIPPEEYYIEQVEIYQQEQLDKFLKVKA